MKAEIDGEEMDSDERLPLTTEQSPVIIEKYCLRAFIIEKGNDFCPPH